MPGGGTRVKNSSEIMRLEKKPRGVADPSEAVATLPERQRLTPGGLGQDGHPMMSEPFILVPRKIEFRYPLKESELARIEELISEIVPQRKTFRTLWSLFAGIAATSVFGLLGFLLATQVQPIVWVVAFVALVTSIILGITFRILDVEEADKVFGSRENALRELSRIRDRFQSPKDPPQDS